MVSTESIEFFWDNMGNQRDARELEDYAAVSLPPKDGNY